jgi:hypothetical protein
MQMIAPKSISQVTEATEKSQNVYLRNLNLNNVVQLQIL